MKTRSLALVLTVLFAVPQTAFADPQDDARALNKQGMAKYEVGKPDEAIELFQKAYEIYPDPKILFNLAQTYRKKRDYEHALETYQAYLRNMPRASNRAAVTARIAELETIVKAQRESDGKPPAGVAPASAPASDAEPAMTGPGPSAVPAPSVSTPPPSDAPSPTVRHWYADKVAWSLIAGGVVAAGIGTGFLISASITKGDLDDATESDRPGIRDSISTSNTIGTIGLVAGGVLIAGGVVKFVLSRSASAGKPPEVATHLFVGPGGFSIAGRF